MGAILTLREALKEGRLADFVAQERARGVGPVDRDELEAAIRATIKPPQSGDRTSRSRGRDGSGGT